MSVIFNEIVLLKKSLEKAILTDSVSYVEDQTSLSTTPHLIDMHPQYPLKFRYRRLKMKYGTYCRP